MIRQALILCGVLSFTGCCGLLFDVPTDADEGIIVESDPKGLFYTLDEIKVFDGTDKLYNPKEIVFKKKPNLALEKPEFEISALEQGSFDEAREVPKGARISERSVDMGWVTSQSKKSEIAREFKITLSNRESFPIRFKIERYAYDVRMYNLPYTEVGIPPRIEDGELIDPVFWIQKFGKLKKLHIRNLTARTVFKAYVDKADFEKSEIDCPKKFGAEIYRRSTPVFAALYHELVGLPWPGATPPVSEEKKPG